MNAKGNPNIVEAGEATQFPHNDPTKGGRKVSIKKQVLKLLDETTTELFISHEDVIDLKDDGSVVVKLPSQTAVAMKLVKWAMDKEGGNSLRAIQMIMEQIDGKPKMTHELQGDMSVTWNEVKTYDPIKEADPGP